jgi:hypothetical protein
MNLEVISQPALLFVHGAWQNFIPYFAGHSDEKHALNLRGHGRGEGSAYGCKAAKKGVRLWHTDPFVPHMAHDRTLDRGWQSVADRIPGWLNTRKL